MTTESTAAQGDELITQSERAEEHVRRSESAWYRKPATLAAGALGITAILSIVFA